MSKSLPSQARVVVIGGGIAGCSVAYHLTKLGWNDVVVLERKTLAGGTTWHAAGLVTQFRATKTMIDINRVGVDLYGELERETGVATGFRRTGSVTVTRTKGRLDELRRTMSMARCYGVEIHDISAREAGEMWPLMRTDDLYGAIHIPNDGQTIPAHTCLALARGAEMRGARIVENIEVTGIETRSGAVSAVVTDQGRIDCDYVVLSAGMWSRRIGLMAGVNVPLYGAEHMFLVTNKMGIPHDIPSLRDPDEQIYFRRDPEEQGAVLMGGFETRAKPWGGSEIPRDYHFGLLEPDWDHFKVFWENAVYRVPAMEEAGINRFYVSAESFTPDNRYLMGEAPEVRNIFLATGLNSTGIAASAGVGKAVAEWMIDGEPTMDLWEMNIQRFHGLYNNRRFLYDRTKESVGTLYGMHWPFKQWETARGVRKSPLHDRIAAAGACFGDVAGYERPNWYAPAGVEPKCEYSFQRQNFFPYTAEEHRGVREGVGLFDQSSFAKFLLQGRDAEAVARRIFAGDVGGPVGRIVYTGMLNERGCYEGDVTVTRLSRTQYMIVTGVGMATHDYRWIEEHIPQNANAVLTDVSNAYAVLSIMGPNSRALLSSVTDTDLSNEAFPFATSREIDLGYATVRASRITYVGELGWELYIPADFAAYVYDLIIGAGRYHSLIHAGYHALESLRTEKGYRAWGHDISDLDTPIEAGLTFAVAFDKDVDFIGRAALERQRKSGVTRRLAQLALDDPEPLLYGNEPIYRDGALVGRTTSGAYGHTVGRAVGMGYVERGDGLATPAWVRAGRYEIEVAGERVVAQAQVGAWYDAKGERVRG